MLDPNSTAYSGTPYFYGLDPVSKNCEMFYDKILSCQI